MKFRQLLNESVQSFNESSKNIYLIDNTLWAAYAEGSGTTAVINNLNKFLTDKKDDANFNTIVSNIVKDSKDYNSIAKGKNYNLYELPKYRLRDAQNGQLNVWDGNIKPMKMYFMLITNEQDYHIINFFESKKEALAFAKSSE